MPDLEVAGTRGFFRPAANLNFEGVLEMVAPVLRRARAMGVRDVLINTVNLTGFDPPQVYERFAMAMMLVDTAGSVMRVAVVARPEYIDPEKIGMFMFENRGGSGDVFETEAEALAWLDAPRPLRSVQAGGAHVAR
jgi:hypothetical protein